jgi:hypothetical protein
MFSQSFSCSDLLVANLVLPNGFKVQGYHLVSPDFPDRSSNQKDKDCWLVPFRSPLLRESRLISFPPGT